MGKSVFDPQKDWKDIFNNELQEHSEPEAEHVGDKEGTRVNNKGELEFNLKPEELESFLNKYVIGQEEAIEIIATKVCTHFNRMKLEKSIPTDQKIVGNIKSNMLMIGATGVGKTYIVKLIANKIGVPFVKADATKFSETGYVGGDVEDLVRELVHEADGDITKAEYGIIYLDEIDKIASSGSLHGPDVSRSGVQRNLLKLMEDADVDLKTPHDLASQVEAAMEAQREGKVTRKKINTKNILFIVSGAFSGLEGIIKKRLNMQSIGFESSGSSRQLAANIDLIKQVKTEDLLEFGFESEFIGRLPVSLVLNDVNEEVLYQILKNKYSSVVNGKKLDFKSYGIEIEFKDDALHMLAEKAVREKTGARGLLSVFERTLIKFEKTLPSLEIDKLVVDAYVVENPDEALRDKLINDSVKGFQKDFLVRHGVYLDFTDDAVNLLQEKASKEHKSFKRICEDLFHDYPYAIKLLKLDKFVIPREAIEDAAAYIDHYVRDNYNTAASSTEN
jgi:endopeptidase Clp ATP-binding regulatory subunit ClpX